MVMVYQPSWGTSKAHSIHSPALFSRYALNRKVETVDTPYGQVRIKRASGMGVFREKAEYEDLAALARKQGVSLNTIREAIRKT